jgi:hypothetical protein
MRGGSVYMGSPRGPALVYMRVKLSRGAHMSEYSQAHEAG